MGGNNIITFAKKTICSDHPGSLCQSASYEGDVIQVCAVSDGHGYGCADTGAAMKAAIDEMKKTFAEIAGGGMPTEEHARRALAERVVHVWREKLQDHHKPDPPLPAELPLSGSIGGNLSLPTPDSAYRGTLLACIVSSSFVVLFETGDDAIATVIDDSGLGYDPIPSGSGFAEGQTRYAILNRKDAFGVILSTKGIESAFPYPTDHNLYCCSTACQIAENPEKTLAGLVEELAHLSDGDDCAMAGIIFPEELILYSGYVKEMMVLRTKELTIYARQLELDSIDSAISILKERLKQAAQRCTQIEQQQRDLTDRISELFRQHAESFAAADEAHGEYNRILIEMELMQVRYKKLLAENEKEMMIVEAYSSH